MHDLITAHLLSRYDQLSFALDATGLSDLIKSVVKVEDKVLHLVNPAFEERYFETSQLEEALKFISPVE